MADKWFDECPKCGEHVNIEYGHVYVENGVAYHKVECLECGCVYTLEYAFKEKVVYWGEEGCE